MFTESIQVDKYNINKNYKTNPVAYFDDTASKDEWQREVYEYARIIAIHNDYQNIVDFGCGSAYKLVNYFKGYNTVGVDVPATVNYLKATYPNRVWQDTLNPLPCDILIAADVIEHMEDPGVLLDFIKLCNPKEIIISTVDRNMLGLSAAEHYGPPRNTHHIREWSFSEFKEYISKHFDIVEHTLTNVVQATQMVHARIRYE